MTYDLDCDTDVEELKAQTRHERVYLHLLLRHPNCRDPDHPGCQKCEGEGDYDKRYENTYVGWSRDTVAP